MRIGLNFDGIKVSDYQNRSKPLPPQEYMQDSFKIFLKHGIEAVRIPVYWESYEKDPDSFIEELNLISNEADKNNISCIYDNHQWECSSFLGYGIGFPNSIVSPLFQNNSFHRDPHKHPSKKDVIREAVIENTARIIAEVKSVVLCVVEAEHRIALKRFNDIVIPKINGTPYDHVMFIDGNDDRGIDVGIITRKEFKILSIISHIYDTDDVGTIFSRDCAEYHIATNSGNNLIIFINHFKSKGYGSQEQNDKKRIRQAKRVREIYDKLVREFDFIAIVGDLNDTPNSKPLYPLLKNNSNLVDVMDHEKFVCDGRLGTHGNGNKTSKLDYILMSPELSKKVKQGGIERRGVWGGKNGDLFPHLPQIKSAKDAVSDHAALWVDLDI
jgi:endonuclease/exonuclease/phosphatase family metal-dependent hydrolase